MNLLAIDTSSEQASVALAVGEHLYTEEQGSLRQHAQFLLPMIERLLERASIGLKQLDGVIFGCGPGSFTGLRITCSLAKGLAYAHDLPLYPVSSLSAIADEVYQGYPAHTPVLAMLDARMHEVYWAYFSSAQDRPLERVSAAKDIILPADEPFVLAGVGLSTYATQMPQGLQTQCIKQIDCFPHARAMIRLVRSGGIPSVSASDALPIYVREFST
jgi:tRNA threonylcarbamoyladenosine biosynthesis protein TsaB